jgi:hypothetical protein
LQKNTPVLNLPPELRIANTEAVLHGAYGAVTQRARRCGTSRQALYRDAPAVLHAIAGTQARQEIQALRQENQTLHDRIAQCEGLLAQVVPFDAERQTLFACTAQAEGVSLPVARRLMAVLLREHTPSVATLGRMTQAAALKATALLAVLDAASRPQAEQVAADEIFFGKKACLMLVEQHSLCWLSGRLTEQRTGAEWAKEFAQLPRLRQTTQDGGTALAKGLELINHERQRNGQEEVAAQDDHFHVQRDGRRALRRLHGRVAKQIAQAEEADRKATQKERQTGDGRGRGAASLAWRRAERALDAWAAAAAAWEEVEGALRLFTPEGALNTRPRAQAVIEAALPRLSDPVWAKVRRSLGRPQLLTFLDEASQGLSSLPLPAEVRSAAVRVAGLRRQPAALAEGGSRAGVLRGMLLMAGLILALSGEVGAQAVGWVREVLRGVWRASSLVECLNSVARMQQGRHRKMTQGLLDLKRLYWNCRQFRTGRRRGRSPYELHGLNLPTEDWWELLKLTPQQLRERLGRAEPPAQELSAPKAAA